MNITDLAAWIESHESLLSGFAAAIAILGVAAAAVRLGWRSVARRRKARAQPAAVAPPAGPTPIRQDVRYCRTSDGVRLAYSRAGTGEPLVRALGWFTNLEMEWQHDSARWFWERLAEKHCVIRYDGRGMGLSDREVGRVSPATRLADLEAVVDAAGLERFDMIGLSEGGATAVAYAARHPERVRRLVLCGTYLKIDWDAAHFRALIPLMPEHWGKDNKSFHQLFTALFIPHAAPDDIQFFNELQRSACSGEMARSVLISLASIDQREDAARLRAPTLVIHGKGDLVIPLSAGKLVAATIPGARLELIDASNHLLWYDKGVRQDVLDAVESFLAEPAAV
jgi:pimeloyl-ACP methyl ester carboxylesterase